jgi:hypothetical protein
MFVVGAMTFTVSFTFTSISTLQFSGSDGPSQCLAAFCPQLWDCIAIHVTRHPDKEAKYCLKTQPADLE